MIEIQIKAWDDNIKDQVKFISTTLLENAMALRRLEEIKLKLLAKEYESDFEIREDKDD